MRKIYGRDRYRLGKQQIYTSISFSFDKWLIYSMFFGLQLKMWWKMPLVRILCVVCRNLESSFTVPTDCIVKMNSNLLFAMARNKDEHHKWPNKPHTAESYGICG